MHIPWSTVWATSASVAGFPLTGYRPVADIHFGQTFYEVRNRQLVQIAPGFQTSLGNWVSPIADFDLSTTPDGYTNTNGIFVPSNWTDMLANLAPAEQVRFGFHTKWDTGAAGIQFAQVRGLVQFRNC
jgi:hypothetical protein